MLIVRMDRFREAGRWFGRLLRRGQPLYVGRGDGSSIRCPLDTSPGPVRLRLDVEARATAEFPPGWWWFDGHAALGIANEMRHGTLSFDAARGRVLAASSAGGSYELPLAEARGRAALLDHWPVTRPLDVSRIAGSQLRRLVSLAGRGRESAPLTWIVGRRIGPDGKLAWADDVGVEVPGPDGAAITAGVNVDGNAPHHRYRMDADVTHALRRLLTGPFPHEFRKRRVWCQWGVVAAELRLVLEGVVVTVVVDLGNDAGAEAAPPPPFTPSASVTVRREQLLHALRSVGAHTSPRFGDVELSVGADRRLVVRTRHTARDRVADPRLVDAEERVAVAGDTGLRGTWRWRDVEAMTTAGPASMMVALAWEAGNAATPLGIDGVATLHQSRRAGQ